MNRKELIQQIETKESFLCVGLDTDITKIPTHLLSEKNPVLAFNKAINEIVKINKAIKTSIKVKPV